MLFHTIRKNKVLRVLCMIMLMLIHMDAYMYEAINVFQAETVEQSVSLSEETAFQEEDADVPVWEDLSYSRASVRLNWWNPAALFLPLLLLFCVIFIDRDRKPKRLCLFTGAKRKQRSHLTFCTFLI